MLTRAHQCRLGLPPLAVLRERWGSERASGVGGISLGLGELRCAEAAHTCVSLVKMSFLHLVTLSLTLLGLAASSLAHGLNVTYKY